MSTLKKLGTLSETDISFSLPPVAPPTGFFCAFLSKYGCSFFLSPIRVANTSAAFSRIIQPDMRTDKQELNGILVVDKPAGQSSHDVVMAVRRVAGQRSVGHAGTLDPLATGVLVLGLGAATRVLEYFSGQDKTYESTWQLGVTTDTDDAEGNVLETYDGSDWPSREQLERALAILAERTTQVPPQVSALKQDGVRNYTRARSGEVVDVPARPVEVFSLELLEYLPPNLQLTAHVSKGTYIRSLARDLGHDLGVGAHVTQLRRTQSGHITLEHAVPFETIEKASSEQLTTLLHPIDFGLSLPSVELDDTLWARLINGQRLGVDAFFTESFARGEHTLLGRHQQGVVILQYRADRQVWQPHKVIKF